MRVLILILFLTSCDSVWYSIGETNVKKSRSSCENNGGLAEIAIVDSLSCVNRDRCFRKVRASCNNGAYFFFNEEY